MIRAFACATLMFCAAAFAAAQNFNVAPSLRSHVEYLCNDSLQGRKAGTEGEAKAAAYVHKCLSEAGVVMLTGPDGQDFTVGDIPSRNIVGMVQGYDPALSGEYILLGAHFDNLGTVEMTVDGRTLTRTYPGADDNASGVAALIELAKMVAATDFMFRRSIIFVAFGASECGLAGSWYFANRAFSEIDKVKGAVILDMLGRGNERNRFRIFTSLPKEQSALLLEDVLREPVVTPPSRFEGTLQTSDHLPFYEKKIPVYLFTTGITHEYRTVEDTPSLVLYPNLERHCNYIYHFLKVLSCSDASRWNPVRKPGKADGEGVVYAPADCDKRAQFFHSDEKHFLNAWVYKYLKYPSEAVDAGIQGTVTVTFIVEKNGKVSNVEILRGVDPLLDDEVERVVKASPDWIAAKVKGSAVRTRITLPVEFRLARRNTFDLKGLDAFRKKK